MSSASDSLVPDSLVPDPLVSDPLVAIDPIVSDPLVAIDSLVPNKPVSIQKVMNLSEIIMDFLRRADSKKIELTPKLKQMLALLPFNKDTISHLENMEALFAKIVEDKQVNVMDITEIIELLQEMYIIYDTMKVTVTAEEVEQVFKLLVEVFIQYKLGDQVTEEEKELIVRSIYTILSLCTRMIDLKETTKKLKKQCRFLPCF